MIGVGDNFSAGCCSLLIDKGKPEPVIVESATISGGKLWQPLSTRVKVAAIGRSESKHPSLEASQLGVLCCIIFQIVIAVKVQV